MCDTVDMSVNKSDPLAIWGTPEWDQVLNMLCKLNEQSVETGHVGKDFNAINQLLNGVTYPAGNIPRDPFKLTRFPSYPLSFPSSSLSEKSNSDLATRHALTWLRLSSTPPYPPSSAP